VDSKFLQQRLHLSEHLVRCERYFYIQNGSTVLTDCFVLPPHHALLISSLLEFIALQSNHAINGVHSSLQLC
jgi:hypothetical protein